MSEDLTLVTRAVPDLVTTAAAAAEVSGETTSFSTTVDSALATGLTANGAAADVLTSTVPEASNITGTDSENSQLRAMVLHLSPKPHITVKHARKRKAESAANVTSSPFKQMM